MESSVITISLSSFGVDRSSRLSFGTRKGTHTQTDAQSEPAVTVTESHVLGEEGRVTKQLSVCFPAFAGKVQRKRFQSTRESSGRPQQLQFHRLFCSLAVLDPRGLATPLTYFLHLSLSSVSLIDSYTGSPVHVLMLPSRPCVAFLACVHLASLPCIISFPCFLVV